MSEWIFACSWPWSLRNVQGSRFDSEVLRDIFILHVAYQSCSLHIHAVFLQVSASFVFFLTSHFLLIISPSRGTEYRFSICPDAQASLCFLWARKSSI